ncbi:MAG: hypothetical protein JF886_16415 [Candidatus Dormibacteraeota bacterium]|uniref:Uncharacterized protein n=1 Tax=Candidatus Aeolococcus gillhamiae TaxID=3127015 RepID=A0A934JWU8_9BACT|nr:hypothetical protein [Candidatus Dormibacteraeota bacterium]
MSGITHGTWPRHPRWRQPAVRLIAAVQAALLLLAVLEEVMRLASLNVVSSIEGRTGFEATVLVVTCLLCVSAALLIWQGVWLAGMRRRGLTLSEGSTIGLITLLTILNGTVTWFAVAMIGTGCLVLALGAQHPSSRRMTKPKSQRSPILRRR